MKKMVDNKAEEPVCYQMRTNQKFCIRLCVASFLFFVSIIIVLAVSMGRVDGDLLDDLEKDVDDLLVKKSFVLEPDSHPGKIIKYSGQFYSLPDGIVRTLDITDKTNDDSQMEFFLDTDGYIKNDANKKEMLITED